MKPKLRWISAGISALAVLGYGIILALPGSGARSRVVTMASGSPGAPAVQNLSPPQDASIVAPTVSQPFQPASIAGASAATGLRYALGPVTLTLSAMPTGLVEDDSRSQFITGPNSTAGSPAVHEPVGGSAGQSDLIGSVVFQGSNDTELAINVRPVGSALPPAGSPSIGSIDGHPLYKSDPGGGWVGIGWQTPQGDAVWVTGRNIGLPRLIGVAHTIALSA
jgi:hypothetical protein